MEKAFILSRYRYVALGLATAALVINFWAWSLLGPIASKIAVELSLSPVALSIMLAIPIIVGSLGRIPLGMLTDRYGGHKVFSILCFLAALPVVALAYADTYSGLIVAGIFLGISGASFAVGIPFVNAWFPPEKRGLVLGIYSMGNAGTAISGFLTPFLVQTFDRRGAYLIVAILLFVTGVMMAIWGRNAPSWSRASGSLLQPLITAARDRATWDLSIIYAITFGAFVAFGVYLPVLLKSSYVLDLSDAAARAAGFVLLATLARPLGGWLSDRFGGKNVIRIVLFTVTVLAAAIALQQELTVLTTVLYLSLSVVLGCGNGAVIALVSKLSSHGTVGSVTGIVGACGGLGGFFPPLVLGVTYQATHSYYLSLMMLALASLLVFLYINHRFRNVKISRQKHV